MTAKGALQKSNSREISGRDEGYCHAPFVPVASEAAFAFSMRLLVRGFQWFRDAQPFAAAWFVPVSTVAAFAFSMALLVLGSR